MLVGKLKKHPKNAVLWWSLEFFSLRGTNSKATQSTDTDFLRINTLKGTAKAPAVGPFEAEQTNRYRFYVLLTPKRYNEHPCLFFYIGVPLPGLLTSPVANCVLGLRLYLVHFIRSRNCDVNIIGSQERKAGYSNKNVCGMVPETRAC